MIKKWIPDKHFYFICFLLLIFSSPVYSSITSQGKRLSHFLDQLDVANKWQPGQYVNWLTGKSLGEGDGERITHCSGFVAAATKKLGIYLLRPPEHTQSLLANAQYHWLGRHGKEYGWFQIKGSVTAQTLANKGYLVVATYANHNPSKPGHIAIVRPCNKSIESIRNHGPEIIQAGAQNFNSASLSEGFSKHQNALESNEIRFYAHKTYFDRV